MILIIDNYDSFTYNLFQYVSEIKSDVKVVRNDKITLEEIKKLQPQTIILSPGPGKPEDAGICVELIKTFSGEIPIFGVCLGHQAIGIAFGGNVIQAHEIVHGKSTYVFHHRSGIYDNLPLPFQAGRYHSLIIDKKTFPSELMIEAENNDGLIMGIKHREHPTYGVQFHPESILTPEGKKILGHFIRLSCEKNHVN